MKPRSETAIVSGADSNYYPLLKEWLHSLRRFGQSAACDICIIDAGMTEEQIAELEPHVAIIVNPAWPSARLERKARGQEHLKACVCRPFLPNIFPGYKTYMWMDSDTWVQDWSAVDMFMDQARQKPQSLIITGGADRSYNRPLRVKWFWRWPYDIRNFYFTNAKSVFGFDIAKRLLSHSVLYAGCFAMDANAPHWTRWQKLTIDAASRGKAFTAEQLSLGYLAYIDGYKIDILPSHMHWTMGNKPLWDKEKTVFMEPHPPHNTLGILHLAGVDAMRSSKRNTTAYKTTDGGEVILNCRYHFLDGGDLNGAPKR